MKVKELRQLSEGELLVKEKELGEELFNLRFQHVLHKRRRPKLGGTTDAMRVRPMFGMGFFYLDQGRRTIDRGRSSGKKGARMSSQPQIDEAKEADMQEPEIKVPDDRSLPAEQVIAEQSLDVREHLTPRFVP